MPHNDDYKDGDVGQQFYRLVAQNKLLFSKVLRRFFLNAADIEDITQETLLRAIEARKRTTIRNPKQFLLGVAVNVAREEVKKRAKITREIIEDCDLSRHLSDEPPLDTLVEGREKLRLMCEAVAKLLLQCRRVFVLKHFYGASHKEIGAKLGLSVSTVEKHVAAGTTACREMILARLNQSSGWVGEANVEHLFDGQKRKAK